MPVREPLFPIRRDKATPREDFWHTLRWGFLLSFVVLFVVGIIAL